MAVLGRQEDGSWKWDWVIANSDQPLPGMTADGAEEQALLQIERDFVTAATKGDIAFFERTLAKEYAQVYDGKPVNVAAQLADLKSGATRIESMALRDLRAHVFGDAAIVSMMTEGRGTYKGTPVSEKSRGVDFFVKRDGRWQVVNSQMTTIKE
jgi:ketosteroid isomerase-like protein